MGLGLGLGWVVDGGEEVRVQRLEFVLSWIKFYIGIFVDFFRFVLRKVDSFGKIEILVKI